jgi:hypothetical protein
MWSSARPAQPARHYLFDSEIPSLAPVFQIFNRSFRGPERIEFIAALPRALLRDADLFHRHRVVRSVTLGASSRELL